jgi:hypothetical protein
MSSTTLRLDWLTNTALSAARLYREKRVKLGYFNARGVNIPVAVGVFSDELYPASQSRTERAYPKLIHFIVSKASIVFLCPLTNRPTPEP